LKSTETYLASAHTQRASAISAISAR